MEKGFLFNQLGNFKEEADAETLWKSLQKRMDGNKKRPLAIFWWLPALLILLGSLAGVFWKLNINESMPVYAHSGIELKRIIKSKNETGIVGENINKGEKFVGENINNGVNITGENTKRGVNIVGENTNNGEETSVEKSTREKHILKGDPITVPQFFANNNYQDKNSPQPKNERKSNLVKVEKVAIVKINYSKDFTTKNKKIEDNSIRNQTVTIKKPEELNLEKSKKESSQNDNSLASLSKNTIAYTFFDEKEKIGPGQILPILNEVSDKSIIATDSAEIDIDTVFKKMPENLLLNVYQKQDSIENEKLKRSRFYLHSGPFGLSQNAQLKQSQISQFEGSAKPEAIGQAYGWNLAFGYQESVLKNMHLGFETNFGFVHQEINYTEVRKKTADFSIDPNTGALQVKSTTEEEKTSTRWVGCYGISFLIDLHTSNLLYGIRLGGGMLAWQSFKGNNSSQTAFKIKPKLQLQAYSRLGNWEVNVGIRYFNLNSDAIPVFTGTSSQNLLFGVGIGKRF